MHPRTMIVAALLVGSPLSAASVPCPPSQPFPDTGAVADDMLDAAVAAALPGFAQNARSLSDSSAQLYLQQVGASNRIAMDNWWSQTGAALIVENVMASSGTR